jgi:hypothetical protein
MAYQDEGKLQDDTHAGLQFKGFAMKDGEEGLFGITVKEVPTEAGKVEPADAGDYPVLGPLLWSKNDWDLNVMDGETQPRKYKEKRPVRIGLDGEFPILLKKSAAAGTAEGPVQAGAYVKLANDGYHVLDGFGSTPGAKSLDSIYKLTERYTFVSTDVAGTIKVVMAVRA